MRGGSSGGPCAAAEGACVGPDVPEVCVGWGGADRAETWAAQAVMWGVFVGGGLGGALEGREQGVGLCVQDAGADSPVGWGTPAEGNRYVEGQRAADNVWGYVAVLAVRACTHGGMYGGAVQGGGGQGTPEAEGTALVAAVVVQESVQGLAWVTQVGRCTVSMPPCEGAECSQLKQEGQGAVKLGYSSQWEIGYCPLWW